MSLNVSPLTLGTSRLGQGTDPGSPEEAAAVDVALDLLASSHAFADLGPAPSAIDDSAYV